MKFTTSLINAHVVIMTKIVVFFYKLRYIQIHLYFMTEFRALKT